MKEFQSKEHMKNGHDQADAPVNTAAAENAYSPNLLDTRGQPAEIARS